MMSSSEGGSGDKPPPAAVAPSEGKSGEVKKKTTTTTVRRMTPEQIASYLSYRKTEPVPLVEGPPRLIDAMSKEFLASLPQDVQDNLAAMDLHSLNQDIAEFNEIDGDLAREADDVRRQYLEKGYVEYEAEEEENAPAPAPGRRRHRPGVARRSGTTKRIN